MRDTLNEEIVIKPNSTKADAYNVKHWLYLYISMIENIYVRGI